MVVRSVVQIVLVFIGFELVGMLTGHALGYVLIGAVVLLIAGQSIQLPSKRYFEALASYVKYAWIGSTERRAFGWVDVAVIGFCLIGPDRRLIRRVDNPYVPAGV